MRLVHVDRHVLTHEISVSRQVTALSEFSLCWKTVYIYSAMPKGYRLSNYALRQRTCSLKVIVNPVNHERHCGAAMCIKCLGGPYPMYMSREPLTNQK